jgi:hypothetical protein
MENMMMGQDRTPEDPARDDCTENINDTIVKLYTAMAVRGLDEPLSKET